MSRAFKLALIQMKVCADKAVNLSRAAEHVAEAASKGANVVALPVCSSLECSSIDHIDTMNVLFCRNASIHRMEQSTLPSMPKR